MDVVEVRGGGNLAGCVALKGQAHLLGGNAAAVVGDAQVLDAALAQFHGHVVRARVDAVFHQLLDGGSRTLHHLARGDLPDDLGGQFSDNRHTPLLYSLRAFSRRRNRMFSASIGVTDSTSRFLSSSISSSWPRWNRSVWRFSFLRFSRMLEEMVS